MKTLLPQIEEVSGHAPSCEIPCANQVKWAAEDWWSTPSAEPTVYWEWSGVTRRKEVFQMTMD